MTEIGGTHSNSDGSKVLEPIVHALIAPEFLPSISWSGRGRGKEVKIALTKYIRITNLIAEVVNLADGNFGQLRTLKDLKYKILKYAPAKFGSKDKSNQNDVDNNHLTADGANSKYVKVSNREMKTISEIEKLGLLSEKILENILNQNKVKNRKSDQRALFIIFLSK